MSCLNLTTLLAGSFWTPISEHCSLQIHVNMRNDVNGLLLNRSAAATYVQFDIPILMWLGMLSACAVMPVNNNASGDSNGSTAPEVLIR